MKSSLSDNGNMQRNAASRSYSSKSALRQQRALSQADQKELPGQVSQAGNATKFVNKQFHYIHIPKTAGESFLLDSPLHIGVGSTMKGNNEKTYYETPQLFLNDPSRYSLVFLRKPTSHVLSQFLECKYDPYFQKRTINLPGYSSLDNAIDGFDEWVSNFIKIGIDEKYGKEFGYNCYEPWNMQARYMSASGKNDAHFATDKTGRIPSIQKAETNLRKMDVVGITEYYSASLCLLEFLALDGELSPLCRQCDPTTGQIIAQETQHRETHGVPHHSVEMISEQSLRFIENNLTVIDQQLYEIGLELFADEVENVWKVTGVDLLCRDNYYLPKQVEDSQTKYWNRGAQDPIDLLYIVPFLVLSGIVLLCKTRGRLHHGSSFKPEVNRQQ